MPEMLPPTVPIEVLMSSATPYPVTAVPRIEWSASRWKRPAGAGGCVRKNQVDVAGDEAGDNRAAGRNIIGSVFEIKCDLTGSAH